MILKIKIFFLQRVLETRMIFFLTISLDLEGYNEILRFVEFLSSNPNIQRSK